jgi:hypothetical protein
MRLGKVECLLFVVTALGAVLVMTGCGSSSSAPAQVTVVPATATVYRGGTVQFTARVSGPRDQTVTWSVPSGFGSIDSTGLYTASSDSNGGTIDVTATSNAVPGTSGTAVVTFPLVTFLIAPDAIDIKPGASSAFSATLAGLESAGVTWTVQETGAGSINSAGVYTAPSTEGIYHVVATSTVDANYRAIAVAVVSTTASTFHPTGDTQEGRAQHTATLLPNGKVLVAGGYIYKAYCLAGIASAELYDQDSGAFAYTGTMAVQRYAQTATQLANGDVLITGGFTYDKSTCSDLDPSPAVNSAELYSYTAGSFQLTGSMTEERGGHTATLLADGKVLIAGGGKTNDGPSQLGDGSSSAEVFDPATGTFTLIGNMTAARVGQTATLLTDGRVLITGGWTSSSPIATAELYDPLTGAFSPTGNMTSARGAHSATLLRDGRVLIIGGATDQTDAGSNTAELYDPNAGSFLATGPMEVARRLHTATLLPNGTVVVVGGGSQVAEIYNPATNSFSMAGITEFDRSGHSATLLQNGNVIVVGGFDLQDSLSPFVAAELYQ